MAQLFAFWRFKILAWLNFLLFGGLQILAWLNCPVMLLHGKLHGKTKA